MKHYNKLLLAIAALFLCSCAEEFDPKQIDVDKPQGMAQYEYLNDYGVLKSYIDRTANPNFKLGTGTDVTEFLKKEQVYSAAVSNFNEVVAGNAMKYASIVGNDGSMNFNNVMKFIGAAREAGVGIYGHTLVWHAQQNTKYLNGLIAPVPIDTDPVWAIVTEQDFETDDASNYVNDPNNRTELGFTADGEGANGEGRALTLTNAVVRPNDYDAQFFLNFSPPAEDGVKYRITMDVRSDNPASISTQAHTTPGAYIHWAMVGTINTTTEWQTYTSEVTIGANQVGAGTIAFNLGKTATTYYFDNIKWERYYPTGMGGGGVAMVEQFVNNGFETDDRTNYQVNGAAQLSYTDDGEGVEGRAIKITNPAVQANGYNAQFIVKWSPAMADGDVFEFSVDIRADRDAQIGTQAQRGPGQYLGGYMGNVNVTTEWQTITSKVVRNEMGAIAFDLGKHDTSFYFDNLSLKKEETVGGDRTPEEKKEILTNELERWIAGVMDIAGDYVKAWDVVNEPMDDGNPYALKSDPNGEKPDDFYWQDYLGKDYVRDAVRFARQYGGDDLLLFANDYNLEAVYNSNNKARGLIAMVEYWESDGVTRIDGIGTQMHISYNMNATQQQKQEEAIVTMFELLAATGKLVKVTELDMGINDANGNPINTADVTIEQHQAMAAFYKFIVGKYFEIIPAAQRYGITQWAPTDSPSSSGWRANQPIGLWDVNYNRKPAYGGFADGLAGK